LIIGGKTALSMGMKRRMALAGGAFILAGCGKAAYERAAQSTWAPTVGQPDTLRELVRYAAMAPSSHNSQCWKFRLSERRITILPNLARRCPAVDPDNHHLFVSLGCATENLMEAALAHGYQGVAMPSAEGIEIALAPVAATRSELFAAIPERQSTRTEYNGRPLLPVELQMLEQAGAGEGVRMILITERRAMENVLEYVVRGNTAQMNDPAFVTELKRWIRFSDAEAAETRDGLFARASGNPAMPGWLIRPLFSQFFTEKGENEKYARHVRSSAGIAVFVSAASDPVHWINVGRAFERFALQATALGIRTAHLNQPVEVSALRPQFASFLGISSGRPDLVVRFGRGPLMPRSLRRPVEAILV